MIYIKELLEDNPIIAAVKDFKQLDQALESEINVIFVLFGDIINIKEISKKIKNKNKIGIVHLDLVEGLINKEVAVRYIKDETSFHGIISTKSSLIKISKNYNLIAIQRVFVFDTISLNNSKNHLVAECDAIEVLPGVIPKVIKEISEFSHKPVVAGGLIDSKDDVILALNAGATCVSTSRKEIWEM